MTSARVVSGICAVTLALAGAGCAVPDARQGGLEARPSTTPETARPNTTMKLTSTAFGHNQSIPPIYTCDGKNISPPLAISDVPTGTRSLALLMDDPDVPASAPVRVWDHWIVFNIPPETTDIPEAQDPPGILGKNTRGDPAYGGPCPPDREHRYFFKLYALDAALPLPAGSTKRQVEQAMVGHILAQTELIGLYNRK